MFRVSESPRDLDQRANHEYDRGADHEDTDRDEERDQKHEHRFFAKRCDSPKGTAHWLCVIDDGPESHPRNGRQ
jgi:hypothetical protein